MKHNSKQLSISQNTRYTLHTARSNGQVLVGVLAIVAISSVIITSLMMNSLISADASLRYRQSINIYHQAETALQNAIMQLERNPDYAGESLTLNNDQVIIEVTGDSTKTVLVKSVTSDNNILLKLQVQVNFDSNGIASVDNWTEL